MGGSPRHFVLYVLPLVLTVAAARPVYSDQTGTDRPTDPTAVSAIDYLIAIGEEALEQQRYSEAMARFSEVLRLDWNHPRAFNLLQQARGERAAALVRWEAAGRTAQSKEQWGKAIRCFELVAREDTARTDIGRRIESLKTNEESSRLVRIGLEKMLNEEYASAQSQFEQALTFDPNNEDALAFSDRAARYAAESASLAELRNDEKAWSLYRNALLKFRAGELDEAERLWREVLIDYPGHEDVLSNLEQIQKRRAQDPMIKADAGL